MKELIPGLTLIDDFISDNEASELINLIDTTPWLEDLSRRVQHYGWKYDYRARAIDSSMDLGPLPSWAEALSEKMFKTGNLPFKPDQVIVNEYIKNQSISKHVDCIPCFKDGIASLSLLEAWEMIFTHHNSGQKYALELPARSLLIFTGPSRYEWTHEIPKRLIEPSGLTRGRRLSLTFRTVRLGE